MSILALNTGSSSLKFGLFDAHSPACLLAGEIDWVGGDRSNAQLVVKPRHGTIIRTRLPVLDDTAAAVRAIEAAVEVAAATGNGEARITAVGHRVVHGGEEFRSSTRIDDKVKVSLGRLCELAPLHLPPALRAIEAAEEALPGVPEIAVFDTAFYSQLPPRAYLYPVPYEWYQQWGIRRFGFHGLSHEYCASRAANLLNRHAAELRLITCHLGGGCSATAISGGYAVATTSGFTPLDGLMMGTRCGSIDPGILLHLQRQHRFSGWELDRVLNNFSGLQAISGISGDLEQVEAAAARGNKRARLAFEMFVDRIRSAIGSLAATLGGVDVLTFTDRIGERSAALRAAVCERLEFMGIHFDPRLNTELRPDADIATADSPARILVIHTEEELMVAQETLRVAGRQGAPAALNKI
jgi:acetate kinase